MGSLVRHFYPDKVSGICELCNLELEDIPHLIIPKCPKLADRAQLLLKYAKDSLANCSTAAAIFDNIIHGEDDELKVQFMLDPSVIPEIILAAQENKNLLGKLFKVKYQLLGVTHLLELEGSFWIREFFQTNFEHYNRWLLV